MFSDPLVIIVDEAPVTFHRVKTEGLQTSYVEANASSTLKEGLRILHAKGQRNKLDPNFYNERHVVTFTVEEYNTTASRWETLSVNLTMSIPNSGIISRAQLNSILDQVVAFIGDTEVVDQLLRNES